MPQEQHSTGIVSVDIVYRRREYRLADWARDAGASVRPMDVDGDTCWQCHRPIRPGSRYVRVSAFSLHPGCSIKQGALEFLDGHTKAQLAQIAWA